MFKKLLFYNPLLLVVTEWSEDNLILLTRGYPIRRSTVPFLLKGSSAFIRISKMYIQYVLYCATSLACIYNVKYLLCDLPAQHGGMSGEDSGHINLPHPEHVVNDAWKPNIVMVGSGCHILFLKIVISLDLLSCVFSLFSHLCVSSEECHVHSIYVCTTEFINWIVAPIKVSLLTYLLPFQHELCFVFLKENCKQKFETTELGNRMLKAVMFWAARKLQYDRS